MVLRSLAVPFCALLALLALSSLNLLDLFAPTLKQFLTEAQVVPLQLFGLFDIWQKDAKSSCTAATG